MRLAGAIFVLLGLPGGFGVDPASAANDGDRKLTDSTRTMLASGANGGGITTLADGSLGVIYEQGQSTPVGGSNVSLEWIRSTDGGLSWSTPITLAERLGSGGQLYDPSGDGGYIVYATRGNSVGLMSNGRIVAAAVNFDYYYDSQGQAEQQNYLGSTFRYAGMTYTYSDDFGQTWSPLQSLLPNGPFGGVHTYTPYINAIPFGPIVTVEENGVDTALMSVYGSRNPAYTGPLNIPSGTTYMAGLYRSTDDGLTWGDPSLIMTKSAGLPYEETALSKLSGDKLLAEMRTPADTLVQYTSADLGRTWQVGTAVTQTGQIPGSALQLADGKLMLTWGNRRPPYGAMAMISTNGGKTWDYDRRVSLAWDASNADCGYPSIAQAGDGSIVVTYYAYPHAAVYAVRFTEDQFLAAAGYPKPSTGGAFFWDGSGDPATHGFTLAPASTTPFQFDTESGLPQPGVAYQNTTADNTLSGIYEATVNLRNADGWMVEARVQVLQNTGDHFGVYFGAEDEVGGVAALLRPDQIEWFNGGFETYTGTGLNEGALITTAINEGYHTLTITLAPNETAAHVWVDGVDQGAIDLTPAAYYARAVFGDYSSGSGGEANWDYVNVNIPTPEPSTLVLLATGLLGLLYYAWRKQRR